MLIWELIEQYQRASGVARRREDSRHAAWWGARIGRNDLSAFLMPLILQQLEVLASYGRSPSTVCFYLRFLRRVSAWGALMGYLAADPCAGMELPKQPTPSSLRVLTEEEEGRLCLALGPPYALWVKFSLATGLKQSEQFTLRWRDVDLDRAMILLPHPATGAISALSITSATVAILRQLRHMQPPSLWVFPDLNNPFRAVNIHAFYVGRWVAAVHRAGIAWCTWKDLRHTCGARLAKQGLPVTDILRVMRQRETKRAYIYRAYVAGRIGHKSPPRPRGPVFVDDAAAGELRAAILRDLNNQPLTFKKGRVCTPSTIYEHVRHGANLNRCIDSSGHHGPIGQ